MPLPVSAATEPPAAAPMPRMTVCPDAGHAASSCRQHDRPRVATKDPLKRRAARRPPSPGTARRFSPADSHRLPRRITPSMIVISTPRPTLRGAGSFLTGGGVACAGDLGNVGLKVPLRPPIVNHSHFLGLGYHSRRALGGPRSTSQARATAPHSADMSLTSYPGDSILPS